jgi:hypothetical protein
LDSQTKTIVTADSLQVAPKLQHLYKFLIENQNIQPIRDFTPEYLSMFNLSRDVFRRVQVGDPTWIDDVPPNVALLICQRHLLGYDPRNFESIADVSSPG